MKVIRVVDWFAGIGGFTLGLEMAGGFETVAFSEIDPYACKVLEKHWPDVPNLGDVNALDSRDSLSVRLCRESGSGAPGEESLANLSPDFVLLENVPQWRSRGLADVLRDLAAIGFDAEWFTLCPCLFGKPHHRPRVFVLAYPNGNGEPFRSIHAQVAELFADAGPMQKKSAMPAMGMDDGISGRAQRNRCLGNSVSPIVVAWIGARIRESIKEKP